MFEKMAIYVLGGYHGTRSNFHSNSKNRNFHALSLRLAGGASIDCHQKHLEIKTGDILYIPAHVDYLIQGEHEEVLVIHFEAYNTQDTPSKDIFSFTPHDTEHFAALFWKVISHTNQTLPSASLQATSALYQLLSEIEKENELSSTIFTPGMINAVTYLHHHFTDPNISLSLLTEIAAVSDTYFRRMFAAVYKTTPIRYLTRLRLDYAHNLLLSGLYNVEEACQKSGFTDPKYFSKLFKKYKGMSPSAAKAKF